MKKLILLFFATAIATTYGFSQCDKELVITSVKSEMLAEDGSVRDTRDEDTRIEIGKKIITITPGSDHVMTGEIIESTCTWKVPFKEGKSVLKTTFEENGATKKITITIEGKDGKVSFLATFEDGSQKKIRVWATSFEEKK